MRAHILIAGAVALQILAACGGPSDEETAKLAYRQGFEALQARDFAAAERYLDQAAALTPDDPYVALDLGVAAQNLGELDKARAAYGHAIELGERTKPARATDPRYTGRSVAQLARDNLAALPP
jgi:Flp pilus assembly protein TadD